MNIRVKVENEKAAIYTPYNRTFVTRIKTIGGAKWNGEAWIIPANALDVCRNIMKEVYGETDLPDEAEKVTVKVTLHQSLWENREPVVMFGHTIASAFGRDSGARVETGVTFLEGKPTSGGSRANWETGVPEGCVFTIENVSRDRFESEKARYKADFEIVEQTGIDRAALEEEKAKLIKRLEEIERLLAS